MQETPQQDEWSRVFEYAKQDPEHSLEALRVARGQLVRLLKRLPRDSWESCYGIHSERGRETVTRVVELLAGHDLNHMKQIREQLVRAGPPQARS